MIEDHCSLCGCPLTKHTVMTEKVNGRWRSGTRPIGWKCPDTPKRKI